MTQVKYVKDYPKTEFEGKEYYQVGCKICGKGVWKIYSDGFTFLYQCLDCPIIDRIRPDKLSDEMIK